MDENSVVPGRYEVLNLKKRKSSGLLPFVLGSLFLLLGLNAADDEKKSELKPLKKEITDKKDKVIGFQEETEADRLKKKKAASVNLKVHSKLVGLPENVIVVWKDRSQVLSYSRLIKNLSNKKSRYFQLRVDKAKKFLEEKKAFYELIPIVDSKMTIRRWGITVTDVFFNQTLASKDKNYNESVTNRYKGYIISYDIQPVGISIGC